MTAFVKTLFGDGWNVAGVALIVMLAAFLVTLGHPGWAVFAMPATALGVVAFLACQ